MKKQKILLTLILSACTVTGFMPTAEAVLWRLEYDQWFYECAQCPYITDSRRDMNRHTHTHHNFINTVTQLLAAPETTDINAKNTYGDTFLTQAVISSHCKNILTPLLQIPGIDVNIQNNQGYTALMLAVSYFHNTDVVLQLLQVPGINLNAKTPDGKTVFDLATSLEIKDILNRIKHHMMSTVKFKAKP